MGKLSTSSGCFRLMRLTRPTDLTPTHGLMLGVGVFLLLLGVGLVWDLNDSHQRILDDQSALALQRSQVIGQTLAQTLLAADYVLQDAMGHLEPQDLAYPHPGPARHAKLTELLRRKAQSVPGLYNLTVFDRHCVFVANGRGINLGWRSQPEVCQARQGITDARLNIQYLPVQQSASGRAVLVASRNLRSSSGEFLGGMLAVIELDHLQSWLEAFDVSTHDNLTLLDTHGVLLARKPGLHERLGLRIQDPTFAPIFGQSAATAVRVAASPLDGRTRVFALSRVNPFPIWVAVGLDQVRAMADWEQRLWQMGAGYLGLLVLSAALAHAYLRGKAQQAQLAASRRVAQAVLQAVPNQIAVLDARGRIVEVNQAWDDFSRSNSPNPGQLAARTDVGTDYLDVCRTPTDVNPGDEAEAAQAYNGILAVLSGHQPSFTMEYPCHSPTEQRWFSMTVTPLADGSGAVVMHTNITQRRLAEDQARDLAYHDSLTGLPNRRLLADRLTRTLLECRRQGLHAAVLMIDLDRFKPLNDQHGHAAGDALLIKVAQRLLQNLRAVDTAVRLGGDEFVVILGGLDANAANARTQALAVADKIRLALAEPYTLTLSPDKAHATLHYACSASLGLTLQDGSETNADSVLQRTDLALYQAKSSGRNTVAHA
jgi:diguanylate cyclase (GGDEF)-like protein